MKSNLHLSVSVAALFCAAGAVAQDMPRGAAATGCNPDTFSRVISERTGETLYWNNPDRPSGGGTTETTAPPPVDETDAGDDIGNDDEEESEDPYGGFA